MQVMLVMFKADGQRKEFPLSKESVVLGRRHTCDLRIPIPSVSREHCRIELNNGKAVLKDLDSSNGTLLNGKKISTNTLNPGDRITLGPVHFVVIVDGQPNEVKPVTTVLPDSSAVEQQATPEDSVADALSEAASPAAELDDSGGIAVDESGGLDIDLEGSGINIEDSGEIPAVSLDDSETVDQGFSPADSAADSGIDFDSGHAAEESKIELHAEDEEAADVEIAESTGDIALEVGGAGGESSQISLELDDSDAPTNTSALAAADIGDPDDDDDPFADLALDGLDDDDDDMIITDLTDSSSEDDDK